MAAVTPHLRWPLRLRAGRFQEVEQDTLDDVVQCVHQLVRTPLTARPIAPDIGVGDPLWRSRFNSSALIANLADWEPRADILGIDNITDADGVQDVQLRVELAGA